MPRALLIGANSFLGRPTHQLLRERGMSVVGTSRQAEGDLIACDLLDAARVDEVVGHVAPEIIINCAGATQSRDPALLVEVHVRGTLNLIMAARRAAAGGVLVLVGSAAEYGRVPVESLPITEAVCPLPVSIFGATKLSQTNLAMAAAAAWELRVTTLRPFNLLGPGLPAHYFAGAFAHRLLEERARRPSDEMTVTEILVRNAHSTRDFVDVRDAAAAILAAVEHPPAAGRGAIYNVATGTETSILAVAERLCARAGGFRAVPAGPQGSRSSIDRSAGNADRLYSDTGWKPTIGWESSLDEFWADLMAGSAPDR